MSGGLLNVIHAVQKDSQKGFNVSTRSHLTLPLTLLHKNQSIAQARHIGIPFKCLQVKLLHSFTVVWVVDNLCSLDTQMSVSKATVKLIGSGSRHTKPVYRKHTLTQTHFTSIFKMAYVLSFLASHPL